MRDEISKSVIEQEKPIFEASFIPGKFTDNSKKLYISNVKIPPIILFDNICNIVGLPVRLADYGHNKNIAFDIVNLIETSNWEKFFLLIQIGDNRKFKKLQKIFNRIKIAQIPYDIVNKIIKCSFEAVEYWKDKIINGNHNKKVKYHSIKLSCLSYF